jgi:hypothetical protein
MNVQQTILAGIKEQLYLNDYLVMPDFGGFILKHRASDFSGAGSLLMPPSKTVSFNAQLKQNDGILAACLQEKLLCSASEAMQHLSEFAGYCTSILNTKRRLTFDDIGFFYLDFENNLCFEPLAAANFSTSSFGLSPISLVEIAPVIEVEKKESVFVDRVLSKREEVKPLVKTRKNYGRIVTPLILVFLLFGIVALLVMNSKISGELKSSLFNSGSKSGFNPIDYPDLKLVENKNETQAYVADANGLASIELEENKSLTVRVLENKSAAAVTTNPSAKKGIQHSFSDTDFEIVLGCFSVMDNANKMVNKLAKNNVEAFISEHEHKGMHVVSIGSFPSKEAAISKLQEVKTSFPHAWIKKPVK